VEKDDLAVRLWEAAGARRADRRAYEWKVTLGLWGGLLAVAKLALDSRDLPLTGHRCVVITVACTLLLLVAAGHALYEFQFVVPANARDLKEALALEKDLRQGANLPEAEPTTTLPLRWAPAAFQVGVTCLLAAAAGGSVIMGSA